jgi:N-sulfoglucosamine sulfohydrolase
MVVSRKYSVLLAAAMIGNSYAQEVRHPNILWISCEDISPRLGCYGDSVARTPNLDKLAREGAIFTNVYTTAAVSAACRSGIITGMYQTSIGTQHMRTSHVGATDELPTPYASVPPPYVKAFPEYLRSHGYYCTNNSKTDYQFSGPSGSPISIWDECSNTADYKHRTNPDQPFFAVFNYTQTHESQTWLEPFRTDPAAVSLPPYYPDTWTVRKSIARHYDNIATVDSIVGEHLKRLEKEGLAENTIVFFWGDHGDGLPRAKRWIYDSGTHIPLIIRWPGTIAPGTRIDDLISSIDFGPTVLSLAGVPKPYHMQGKAFLGNQMEEPRKYVFSARDRFDESYDMMRTVRDKQYRYVRNYYPNEPEIIWVPYRNRSPIMQELLRLQAEDRLTAEEAEWFVNTRPPEELFDCDKDPWQMHNIASDPMYKDVLERMRRVLDQWQATTGDMGSVSEEIMVATWYPNGKQPETAIPHFVPNAEGNRNLRISTGETLKAPAMLTIYCATEGASIVYTFEEGDKPHWLLYTGPIRLKPGENHVRSVAVRYGYLQSKEQSAIFTVN